MGFLNLCTTDSSRDYGGIGLSLKEPRLSVSVTAAERLQIRGNCVDRVVRIIDRLSRAGIVPDHPEVAIETFGIIPPHTGLGSGTQLSLAVGQALCLWFGHAIDEMKLAFTLERGRRSGIGIGAFTQGGLLIDNGVTADSKPPVIAVRMPVPDHWRFVLIYDAGRQGLHGRREADFFQQKPAMPKDMSARLSELVATELMPAISEADCTRFGAAVTRLQDLNGRCFDKAQGGLFSSPPVEKVLRHLHKNGAAGIGQSSWGPTGFALYDSERAAGQAVREAEDHLAGCAESVLCDQCSIQQRRGGADGVGR